MREDREAADEPGGGGKCCPIGPGLAGPDTRNLTNPVPTPKLPCRGTIVQGHLIPTAPLLPTTYALLWWINGMNGPGFSPSLYPCPLPGDLVVPLAVEVDSVSSSLESTNFD